MIQFITTTLNSKKFILISFTKFERGFSLFLLLSLLFTLNINNNIIVVSSFNTVGTENISDCKKVCADSWLDKIDYETCVEKCSPKPPKIVYPRAPQNVSVSLDVKIYRHSKYVMATVHWESDDDPLREAYYLKFFTNNPYCEQLFPGFYTQDISPHSLSFDIPNHTPAFQPLIIDFGCEYQLEMRSIPYPFGDRQYSSLLTLKVPTCINGYCSCKGQRKPNPAKQLTIESESTESPEKSPIAKVSWKHYAFAMEIENFTDSNENRTKVEFRVKIATLLRQANVAPWRKIFRWTKWEQIVKAERNRNEYFILIPDLIEGNEYKIQVIAYNQDYCRSNETEQEFVFTVKDHAQPLPEDNENSTTTTVSQEIILTSSTAGTTSSLSNDTEEFEKITGVIEPIGPAVVHHHHHLSTGTKPMIPGSIDLHSLRAEVTTDSAMVVTSSMAVPDSKLLFHDPMYTLLPVVAFLCLFVTAVLFCKSLLRRGKFIKKQKYLAQLHKNPWTILENGLSKSTVETNVLYINKDILDARAHGLADEFEIAYDRITQEKVIGYGAFGCVVYLGTADSINGTVGPTAVAIKQLTTHADERERKEFLSEIAMMKQIPPHPNIVRMYGCCTLFYPHCMVMEYVPHGDLLNYLRILRKQYEKQVEEYKESIERDYIMQLNETSSNINSGGGYDFEDAFNFDRNNKNVLNSQVTQSKNCRCSICETCTARIPFVDSDFLMDFNNVVVGKENTTINNYNHSNHNSNNNNGGNLTMLDVEELQSFALQVASGMAHLESLKITHRDLACRNILVGHGKTLKISDFGLSRVGVYVKTTPGKIPLRWLSVEAMRDNMYSTKSDVWSYGIVLWEICTLGGFPYPMVNDNDLLRYLESGQRLTKPSSCSERIYELMLKCWTRSADLRPSFFEIKKYLSKLHNDGHVYVEFSPKLSSVLPPEAYCRVVPLAVMDEMLCGMVAA